MDLLRVCKDVRGTSGVCLGTGPAGQSAMGVAAVNSRNTTCLHGFRSGELAGDSSQRMIPSSQVARRRQAARQIAPAGTVRLSRSDSAVDAGSAPMRRRGGPFFAVQGLPFRCHGAPSGADFSPKRSKQGCCGGFKPQATVSGLRHASTQEEDEHATFRAKPLHRLCPAIPIPIPTRQSTSSISV